MAQQGLIPAAAPAERGAFVERLSRTAERAAAAAGGFDVRRFRIAGRLAELRFAGDALVAPLTAALEHARTDDAGPADLTALIWDSASTGTEAPPPPWGPEDYREHGVVRGWFDEDLQVTWQWNTGALTVFEPGSRRAVYWTATAESHPWFDRAAPLRRLLHSWLASEGLHLTHAAALGDDRGCVLLGGGSGRGKSSAALATLESGPGHIADDYCVLEPNEDGATVHALYSSAKANDDTLARLGLSPDLVENPDREPGDKAVIFLYRHFPERLVQRAPLRAVLVPTVTGERESRLVAESPAAAMAALGPSTLLQLPGTGPSTMGALARVVRSVPCFRLEAGTDPAGVSTAIAELLGP